MAFESEGPGPGFEVVELGLGVPLGRKVEAGPYRFGVEMVGGKVMEGGSRLSN